MAAADRILALIEITKKLATIVQRETKLLKDRRPREIAVLQEEKNRLGAAYEEELTIIGRNSETLAKAAPREMQELQRVVRAFRSILDEHGRVLAAAKVVTERMIRNVSQEVSRQNQPDGGYSRYAKRAKPSRTTRPVSLAVNQVV